MKTGSDGHGGLHKEEFRFNRIFPQLPPFVMRRDVANMIGGRMTSKADRHDSPIPAGYTYFGQFVDHDITRDRASDAAGDNPNVAILPLNDDALVQERSPSLDLDSLYAGEAAFVDPFCIKFQIGMTQPSDGFGPEAQQQLPNDIPRKFDKGSPRPLIGDGRNDENLAVSQMHLLWLKFNNHVADAIQAKAINDNEDIDGFELRKRTRELVTCHYQFIVLHDFLSRILTDEIYQRVVVGKDTSHIDTTAAEIPAMPLEFSVAAYRFGHSLVRETYDWNVNFKEAPRKKPADFSMAKNNTRNFSLFSFTSKHGLADQSLPTHWIIDWRRFFDFTGTSFFTTIVPQKGKAIDPFLSVGMGNIPADNLGRTAFNLAAANLRRSSLRNMPSGQDVARAMGVDLLSDEEMLTNIAGENGDGKLAELLQKFNFEQKAPLWFYILQEANAQTNGATLGELGSLIVAETFMALTRSSRTSILVDDWTPKDSILRDKNENEIRTLPQLIAWIEERESIISPLPDPEDLPENAQI